MNNCFTPRQGLKFSIDKRRLPFLGVLAIFLLVALSGPSANAQVALGSMVGNVTDSSGAAVPAAAVKLTHTETNDVRSTQTNDAGAYTVPTMAPGRYRVEVSKQGFRSFVTSDILLNANSTVRVDAQLQVGSMTESVEVRSDAAVLQTERADLNAVVTSTDLIDLPQPNRTYTGLLEMIPGTTPPSGQLSGGTNNPDKDMSFGFNGTASDEQTVRIEGVNATQTVWAGYGQSYAPSVEAIQNVNVVTGSADAEQGLSGGSTVNLMLKSGTNDLHGSTWIYNSIEKFEAKAYFAGGLKPPHLVNNNTGVSIGGPVKKDKLFFFFAYEGDFTRSADSGILSIPNAVQTGGGKAGVAGDLSGSDSAIYDPYTGTYDGQGRLPFAGNQIPSSRMNPIVRDKILPFIPATNYGGAAVNNNFQMNRATTYNLHKFESKVDYNATSKLRVSARYGKHPYYNFQAPIYGEVLGGAAGFPQSEAGNYLQNGAGTSWAGSATYVASSTLVLDATVGETNSHQVLMPNKANERYGLDVMGIPGVNIGPLPWAGGVPNFYIGDFVQMGASYPALEYFMPTFDYLANATKILGAHTIRAGFNVNRQRINAIENRDTHFAFTGGATALDGGPSPNDYNAIADFLLGLPTEKQNNRQVAQPYLTLRTWQMALYVRDNWKVSRKLTVNYGVRWEKYPVPQQVDGGIYFMDFSNRTVSQCGVGNLPMDCGIKVSNKLFAGSLGIAYRLTDRFVVRGGYSLSPSAVNMAAGTYMSFPAEASLTIGGATSYTPAQWTATDNSNNLSTGIPLIPVPTSNNGVYPIPEATGNLSNINTQKDYRRGYIQSWNLTLQREFGHGWLGSAGYVGMHSVHIATGINLNYGQLGGGAASQPLADIGITSEASTFLPYGTDIYHSLQATVTRRFGQGLTFNGAYTYSKDIGESASILIPQYEWMNRYTSGADRTHHLVLSGSYQLPFGKGKPYLQKSAGSWILGGWTVNGIFNHWSGSPFTVGSDGSSCNCPGNSQVADLINPNVAIVGNGVGGQAYFDPLAYRSVTDVRFGTSGFNQLRGPGSNNIDLGVFRAFKITERWNAQIRGEALNATNTPHFGNPDTNVSNMSLNSDGTVQSLNGFSQISYANPLGRLIDQRYFRFSLRINF
jgi:hypothetical protein